MDEQELTEMIKGQIKLPGVLVLAVVDGLVAQAVARVGPYVWALYPWQNSRKEDSIILTSSQEYVVLPEDFKDFRSIRYRNGSSDGWKLRYSQESVYEYYYPNPTVHTENEPTQVKIVKDAQTRKWRAYFTPVPNSAYTPTLIYTMKYGGIERFDEEFALLLQTTAWRFIYPPGSSQRYSVDQAFKAELTRMIDMDDPFKEKIGDLRVPRSFNVSEGGEIGGNPDDWVSVVDGSDY